MDFFTKQNFRAIIEIKGRLQGQCVDSLALLNNCTGNYMSLYMLNCQYWEWKN